MLSKSKFDNVIQRARGLCGLHERIETGGLPSPSPAGLVVDDLLRSALVLGVSAMDAYYRDKFLERLTPYVEKHGDTKLFGQTLEKAGVSLTDVLELLGNPRPRRSLRNKIATWLMSKPMHDLEQVDALIAGFGISNLTENAAKKDGAKTLRNKVKTAVKRRHEMAHYGDYYSGKGSLKSISRDETYKNLDWIQRLVNRSDEIINSVTR